MSKKAEETANLLWTPTRGDRVMLRSSIPRNEHYHGCFSEVINKLRARVGVVTGRTDTFGFEVHWGKDVANTYSFNVSDLVLIAQSSEGKEPP